MTKGKQSEKRWCAFLPSLTTQNADNTWVILYALGAKGQLPRVSLVSASSFLSFSLSLSVSFSSPLLVSLSPSPRAIASLLSLCCSFPCSSSLVVIWRCCLGKCVLSISLLQLSRIAAFWQLEAPSLAATQNRPTTLHSTCSDAYYQLWLRKAAVLFFLLIAALPLSLHLFGFHCLCIASASFFVADPFSAAVLVPVLLLLLCFYCSVLRYPLKAFKLVPPMCLLCVRLVSLSCCAFFHHTASSHFQYFVGDHR